jgi:hypothetical protein
MGKEKYTELYTHRVVILVKTLETEFLAWNVQLTTLGTSSGARHVMRYIAP